MEKLQLINFIAKVMEESGFKVYKNFKTSQTVLDIYAILPTTLGDFGVVVACKNNDKSDDVGIDVLKEMEDMGNTLKASKVTIVTSSYFTEQASSYASRKNIKLVDRDNLLELAKKYSIKEEAKKTKEEERLYDYYEDELNYIRNNENSMMYSNIYSEPSNSAGLYKGGNKSSTGYLKQRTSRNMSNLDINFSSELTLNIISSFLNILKNPIGAIFAVIIISYFLSFLIGNVLKAGSGIGGLVELLVALLLSYGLAFYAEKNRYFIIKGTVIFFISLIILIVLIFI